MQITRTSFVRKALDYTKVRPTTDCNYKEPQLLQACSSAAVEGFYMLGASGAVTNSAATAVGLTAQKKFGKTVGALSGAATGAALAATAGHFLGAPALVPVALMGGLAGAYSTLRGNEQSRFRDAGAFGLSFAAPFQGGAKAGVALTGLVATEIENEGLRALAAAGMGSAAGLAFGLSGHSGLGVLASALTAGATSALAAVAGPRLGQAMRNGTEDMSRKMAKKKEEQADDDTPQSFVGRAVGVLPMAAFRQGAQAAIMGKADLASWLTGFGIDATLSAYEIYLTKQKEDEAREAQEATPKSSGE
jgi:hypothetical protein